MGKGNVTTVTHPDGTVSKRKSESRIYTHAVVISRTRESLVQDELNTAAMYDERAADASRAIDAEVIEESRPWMGDKTYTTLYKGGEYAGAYVSDQPRPTDEELREEMRGRVRENEKRAAIHRAKAEELRNGPEAQYGVLRWSSRPDLAHKAVTGEFGPLVRPGVTISAVAVD